MRRSIALLVVALVSLVAMASAQQPSSSGPYKILKRAKVGGEGNWDYIWADVAGRRLYIPRRAPAAPPGAEGPASSVRTRLTVFNLDTLEPAGEIDGVGGNGAVVDPKSGHGFTSSKPISMFDTKTMKLIKTIDVTPATFQPDGGRAVPPRLRFQQTGRDVGYKDAQAHQDHSGRRQAGRHP